MTNKKKERYELLWRILIGIVSGIILMIWRVIVQFLTIVNFVVVLFSGTRNKEIANFCELWNTLTYEYLKYMTFVSNSRPWPFNYGNKLIRLSKFEK